MLSPLLPQPFPRLILTHVLLSPPQTLPAPGSGPPRGAGKPESHSCCKGVQPRPGGRSKLSHEHMTTQAAALPNVFNSHIHTWTIPLATWEARAEHPPASPRLCCAVLGWWASPTACGKSSDSGEQASSTQRKNRRAQSAAEHREPAAPTPIPDLATPAPGWRQCHCPARASQ